MPWILFVLGLIALAHALNAWRPVRRPAVASVIGFFAAWLTLELTVWQLAIEVLLAAWLAASGGLATWPGWVGLGAYGITWVLLVLMTWSSLGTGSLVNAALAEAWDGHFPEPPPLPGAPPSPSRQRWWIPWPMRPRDVERISDVPFADVPGSPLRLDLYRHASHPTGCPVVLQLHGGAWVIGDKREQALPLMFHLAARGWLCVSANYRLSPAATFPDHLMDAKRALVWLRRHAAEHGGDPAFVAVTGNSAGGQLAALLALTPNDPAYQPGDEAIDTTVQACVPLYGVYDLLDRDGAVPHGGVRQLMERQVMKVGSAEGRARYVEASPVDRIVAAAPPCFVIHGDQDTLAPVAGARRFVRGLGERSSSRVAYAELPGVQHAFDIFPSPRTRRVVEGIERFLLAVYRERKA
jgi:acetyl esterase/lipase